MNLFRGSSFKRSPLVFLLVTVLLAISLSGCGKETATPTTASGATATPAVSKEPKPTVRIGYQKYASVNIMKSRGTLDKRLEELGYKVQWTEFPGGPQLLEALNVGSIDLGHTGEAPPIFSQAAGAPLVYLAHEPPSPAAEALLIPKDSPIKSVAELKGKKIALNKGSNVHYLLVKLLEQANLKYTDVEVVFLPPADARVAFERGSVDAWVIWEPFYSAAQVGSGAKVLANGKDLVKNYEFYLGSRSFATKYPDVVDAYLKDLGTTNEWAKANLPQVAKQLSGELGIDVKALELALANRAYGIQIISDTVIKEQQLVADAFFELKLIPNAIKVSDAVIKK
ncbi:MAG: sulfonate transporter substrate-binding protein [Paenibacillus sp.]|nr:sulfonate transporter substrate-binding protein [Paenibacillus sp.]